MLVDNYFNCLPADQVIDLVREVTFAGAVINVKIRNRHEK